MATQPIVNDNAPAAANEIVATRLFDASRELVWKAWTDPAHLVHWWGPDGFTNTFHEHDFRPGGVWRFVMHGPDGTDYPNEITFVEITPPERLVYAHGDDGAPHIQDIVTFTEEVGRTRVTMRLVFPSAEIHDAVVREHSALDGAQQTLNRLAQHLTTM